MVSTEAPYSGPAISRAPVIGSIWVVIGWLFGAFDGFFGFLARELVPSPRRIT